jgi:malonyl-CoA reductase/3-hydroxypropionate dehydrogenase (NADP+)
VRYDNDEEDNLTFSADWAATLTNRVRRMDPINLWVPKSIKRATGKAGMPMAIQRVLPGLHKGKTAVITGGSLGIGLQLGRYLAIAGARVLLSARSEAKLEEARGRDRRGAARRRLPEARGARAHPAGHRRRRRGGAAALFEHSLELFGHVDFLINNAGIFRRRGDGRRHDPRGLEPHHGREPDLQLLADPQVRAADEGARDGVVMNVSSYFGGEKYVAVAYPNRADYAVSKAGQRVLAEILSRHLGPEIQINALAPGPVDGARLRGSAARRACSSAAAAWSWRTSA